MEVSMAGSSEGLLALPSQQPVHFWPDQPPTENRLDPRMEEEAFRHLDAASWEGLQEILKEKPQWVRARIESLISKELQRSHMNVASQIRVFKECMEEVAAMGTMQEARELKQLLRGLKDSDLRSLERDASCIDSVVSRMTLCIQDNDFKPLKQFANIIEKTTQRFTEKYTALQPCLDTLAARATEIAQRFQKGKEQPVKLVKKAEARRDAMMMFLGGLGMTAGIVALAGLAVCIPLMMKATAAAAVAWNSVSAAKAAYAVAVASTQQSAANGFCFGVFALVSVPFLPAVVPILSVAAVAGSLTASAFYSSTAAASSVQIAYYTGVALEAAGAAALFQGLAITSGVILALFLLGYAGRDHLKRLLGSLWREEIAAHVKTAKVFEEMEQYMHRVADQLRGMGKANDELLKVVDLVRETAEELADTADVADDLSPPAGPQAEFQFQEQVASITELVQRLESNTNRMLPALFNMQEHIDHFVRKLSTGQATVPLPLMDHVEAVTNPIDRESGPTSSGRSWELITEASEMNSSSQRSHAASEPTTRAPRCLLPDTHILIPITEVARLGRVTAAGPCGSTPCLVYPQGNQERSLVELTTKSGELAVTATHRLALRRGQCWLVEEANFVREGDVVRTVKGEEEVTNVRRRAISENVFELNVIELGHERPGSSEIFVVSPNGKGASGQMFGPSVAVLGTQTEAGKLEARSSSAPPRLGDLPSQGSRLHPTDGSPCGNICRKFQKHGVCRDGRHCNYCHCDHKGASKRAPRGPRNERA